MACQSSIRWLQVDVDIVCVYQVVATSYNLKNEFLRLFGP